MATGDLVTLSDLQTAAPDLTEAQLADAPALITAASLFIGGPYPYARAAQVYSEEHEVGTNRSVSLKNPRVVSVARVATDNAPVLTIVHTGGARRAGIEVAATGEAGALTSTGLILSATTAGVDTAPITLDWAAYPTVQLLADAVNAKAGWMATVNEDFGDVASVDLLPVQGYKSAIRAGAQLRAYARDLDDWQLKDDGRTLLLFEWREDGYRFPDKTWGVDPRTSTIRVTYTAGWRAVPADIQRACLMLVKGDLEATAKAGPIVEEQTDDYRYKLGTSGYTMPPEAKRLLSRYRDRSFS